ncbi:MAG: hypothetical protein EOM06_15515, partial [Sphingobacteriia bacterium]|nr:hypothetical protein [Sphingobacteriia bacterium]
GNYNDYLYDPQNPYLIGLLRPDVVAPGVDVISLHSIQNYPHWEYCYTKKTGTSMSAPVVSGVMALMLSKNQLITPAELDMIIETTALHPDYHPAIGSPKDNEIGSGRVRADLAFLEVPDCVVEIYEDQILDDTITPCDIFVKDGATLTINKKLWMRNSKKIVVEPQGKLILDGAIISGYDNQTWQGIEVWGNHNANQFPDQNGNYLQGVLIVNDAVIENAVSAVELWKPGDYTKTGGIVFADDATFRNNAKSVHALFYTNEYMGGEANYNSYFKNCTFEITQDYPGENEFFKHVDLNHVKGIRFEGCDFSLQQTTGVSPWNSAIAAYNAGFNVSAYCMTSQI